jgi:hypothetical protein
MPRVTKVETERRSKSLRSTLRSKSLRSALRWFICLLRCNRVREVIE